MKKRLVKLLMLVVVSLIALSGCTGAKTNPLSVNDHPGQKPNIQDLPGEIQAPTLLGINSLEPIVAGEKGVMVFEPAPSSQVTNGKINFRGLTNTFEGTANYRLKSDSQVVQEGFVTGRMGDWGYFSQVIELPENTAKPLALEIFIINAKDGQEIDKFVIPLEIINDTVSRKKQQTQGAFAAAQLLPIDESASNQEFKEFLESMMAAVRQKNVPALKKHLADNFSYSFGHDLGLEGFIKYWQLDQNPGESAFWGKLTTVIELGGTFDTIEGTTYFFAPYVFSAFPAEVNEYEFAAIINKNVPVFSQPAKNAQVLEHLDYHLLRLQDHNPHFDAWVNVQTPAGQIGYVEGVNLRSPLDYKAGFGKEDGHWQMIYFIAGD